MDCMEPCANRRGAGCCCVFYRCSLSFGRGREVMKKILVIGSTGKVGGALTEALVRAGQSVKAATRSPEKFDASNGVESVRFDYADASTYASALDGVDRVFMMEPQPPLDDSSDKRMIPFLEEAA